MSSGELLIYVFQLQTKSFMFQAIIDMLNVFQGDVEIDLTGNLSAHYRGHTGKEKSGNATKPAIFTTGVLDRVLRSNSSTF